MKRRTSNHYFRAKAQNTIKTSNNPALKDRVNGWLLVWLE